MAGRKLTAAELDLQAQLQAEAEKTRELAELGGWTYGSVAALVLDLGRWFVNATDRTGHADSTFSGPATWARATPGLVYVEGYYLHGESAKLGAWCATQPGEVTYGPVSDAYLGVPVPEAVRSAATRRTGSAGMLIGQPQDGFRLLRQGFPAGALLDAGYRHDR